MKKLGSFRIFWSWAGGQYGRLGSFRIIGGLAGWSRGQIGFVLHFWVVGRAGIGFVSYIWLLAVCFWRLAGWGLGSFRILGSWGWCRWGKLGSFCIIGGWGSQRDAGGTANWVRFVKSGCWLLAIGCWPGGIGFVSLK